RGPTRGRPRARRDRNRTAVRRGHAFQACRSVAQGRPLGGSERSERGGMTMSVAKGRPERRIRPLGGSERSERGGMYISVAKGRPERRIRPLGGSERSERGGMTI